MHAERVESRTTLHPKAEHEALVAAREHQKTEAFKQQYKARSGVEGTVSGGLRARGAAGAVPGAPEDAPPARGTAAAMNHKRALAWLGGVPRSGTRVSHLARLAVAACFTNGVYPEGPPATL